MRTIRIMDETRASVIGDHVEVAETSLRRLVGLLGRRGIEPGGGLWIRPSSGIHTFGMSFPIDVIGLDKELNVVRLWNRIVPYRITALSWRMCSALELPAGRIAEAGVQLGDRLRVVPGASHE